MSPAAVTPVASARVAVLRGGRVGLEEVPLSPRRPGEVDVAVDLAAVCGSDLHMVSGRRAMPDGIALGHEAVGRVLDVDPGTRDALGWPVGVGDRVVFGMIASCGGCDRCARGLAMKCRDLMKYGHSTIDTPPHAVGMLADVVRLTPRVTLLRAPDLPDAALVSVPCAVPTAWAAVQALGPAPRTVAVLGAGAVGCYVVAILRDAGAEVVVIDPDASRRGMAAELGATPVDAVPPEVEGVIEASGAAAAVRAALVGGDVGTRVVLVGTVSPGDAVVDLDPAELVLGCRSVRGVHNYGPDDLVGAVGWLRRRGIHAPELAGDPFPLDEVAAAVDEAGRQGAHRVTVRPAG